MKRRKLPKVVTVALILVGTFLFLPATADAASTTFCDNGGLASGEYKKVVVPPGAVCFVETPIHIKKGLVVQQGATFVLGSEDDHHPDGIIEGGVKSDRAASVQIHFTNISGGVDLNGGIGPFNDGPFCFGGPDDPCFTWNTIEDSSIKGDVSITNYNGFWQGFIRNSVTGTVSLKHNVLEDSDGNEVVTNTITGSLRCNHNSPAPQQGDSGGSPNVVGGGTSGQCVGLDQSSTSST